MKGSAPRRSAAARSAVADAHNCRCGNWPCGECAAFLAVADAIAAGQSPTRAGAVLIELMRTSLLFLECGRASYAGGILRRVLQPAGVVPPASPPASPVPTGPRRPSSPTGRSEAQGPTAA